MFKYANRAIDAHNSVLYFLIGLTGFFVPGWTNMKP